MGKLALIGQREHSFCEIAYVAYSATKFCGRCRAVVSSVPAEDCVAHQLTVRARLPKPVAGRLRLSVAALIIAASTTARGLRWRRRISLVLR